MAVLSIPIALAEATPAFRTLNFLPNGNYRFDKGPELDRDELKSEIIGMAQRHDCPDVHLANKKLTRYDTVAAALVLFQKYGCNDLGFRGIENKE